MRYRIQNHKSSRGIIGRLVFLLVLLAAAATLALSTAASANEAGSQGATAPGASQPSTSQKVFKDDYEKHLIPVTQPRPTKMIWLGKKRPANQEQPSQSKLIWLRQNNRSD